ncbi:hypothetical protein [Ilumatobacter sp.]|uniref:hypothetical protein n=1 Tax=Ilumatobacter sp. TaxID=1967498 RepID=UPI003B529653
MRRRAPSRTRVAVVGHHATAPLVVAAGLLDWEVTSTAGPTAEEVAGATGATIRSIEEAVDDPRAEIVVVGTPEDRRLDDARRLGLAGSAVVVVPGRVDADRIDWTPASPLVVGDALLHAPVVRRWLGHLGRCVGRGDVVRHLSLAWSPPAPDDGSLSSSVAGIAVVARRMAGRQHVGGPDVVRRRDRGLATVELQFATDTAVARAEVFPTPVLELDGDPIEIGGTDHPAVAFGAVEVLRGFADDVAAGRAPVLGLDHLVAVERERRSWPDRERDGDVSGS